MKVQREIDIMNVLQTRGTARITELSELLAVSKNTIRRDLRSLESQGVLKVAYGGAVLAHDIPMGPPLSQREVQFIDEKQRIGQAANALIPDGAAVLLDAGTTTEQIAVALHDRVGLTVVTNGLNIMLRLADASDLVAVSTGGTINTITRCFVGFHAEQFLSQFHVDIAFVAAGGVTARGVTNTNTAEVQMKKTMLEIAEKTVLVVTHDKIGRTALAPFADLSQIHAIITDNKADPAVLETLRPMGPEMIIC